MQRIYSRRGLAYRIAEHLGIAPQAVQQWKKVPAEHVMDIADMLGMVPEQIRPDIFKRKNRRA